MALVYFGGLKLYLAKMLYAIPAKPYVNCRRLTRKGVKFRTPSVWSYIPTIIYLPRCKIRTDQVNRLVCFRNLNNGV